MLSVKQLSIALINLDRTKSNRGCSFNQRKRCSFDVSKTPEDNEKLALRLLKHPGCPYYLNIPPPQIQESSPAAEPLWKDGAEHIPGFTEFRKYKKMNEVRVITPYKAEDYDKEKGSKSTDSCIDLKIDDPQKFFLENFNAIQITNLQSLLNLRHSQPNIGYLTMNRERMDSVDDYDPYRYTIRNYNDIDKSNYVTFSLNGLVEFYKGDADFLPTERLLLECKLLNTLRNIPTFQIFRLWKAFMVWLKRARLRRYVEAKEKMEMFFSKKYGVKSEVE